MKKHSPWLTYILVATAYFMVVLDVTIVNVALPSIQHTLHFSQSTLQWVVTAYALFFGGFLLFGGRAADLYGRRRILLLGMMGFTLFSLLIGLSHTAWELVVLRALQGFSAAFMSPAALSIVLITFPSGINRSRALAYWTLLGAGGAAAGLLFGGVLTQFLGWQWNFFVNVPVGIIVGPLIYHFVPSHEREAERKSLDLLGAFFVTGGLMLLVLGFSQAPEWGWIDARTLGFFFGAILLLIAFIYNEAHVSHPLVPLSFFKIRNVIGANLIIVATYVGIFGMFFLFTLYMQNVLGFSPFVTGLAFLPFPLLLGFMTMQITNLVTRFGYRFFRISGPIIMSFALLWATKLPISSHYFIHILPSLIFMAFGMGLTMMPTITAATSGVPANIEGLASGLVATSQQMGGALGLAVLSGIVTSVAGIGARSTSTVLGTHDAFFVAAIFALLAAVVATWVIKERRVVKPAVQKQMLALTEACPYSCRI